MIKKILLSAVPLLLVSCTSIQVRPMIDNEGNIILTEEGYPIPEIYSKAVGQDREIVIYFEKTDKGIKAHYQRKDKDRSVELATVVKEGIVEGLKIGIID